MHKSLYSAAGWLLPVVVALVATPWLIRVLGLPAFGVWAMCVLLATLVPSLDLGFGVAATRELAGAHGQPGRIAQTARELLGLACVQGVLAIGLAVLLAEPVSALLNFDHAVHAAEATTVVAGLGPWIAINFVNAALGAPLRAQERFGLLAVLSTLGSTAQWLGSPALASMGVPLPGLIGWGIVIALAQGTVLIAAWRRATGRWPLPTLRWRELPRARRFAAASFTGTLTTLATYHADKAIVSAVVGPAAAGLYTSVSNVANKLLGLCAALATVLFPRVSRLHAAGSTFHIGRLYYVANRILMTLNVALACTGLVLAGRFLHLWLGAVVTPPLVQTFQLLIVAYLLTSTSVVASNVLSGLGNARRGAVFATIGGASTLLLALVLVPWLGMRGAALAGLVGMSQALVFDLWLERELRAGVQFTRYARRRTVLGWLVAGSAATLVAWGGMLWLPGWIALLATGFLAMLTFYLVWFGAGFALREERVLLARTLRRLRGARP